MRYVKILLAALGLILAWDLFVERGYTLYLVAASENLLKLFSSRCVLQVNLQEILIVYPGFETARSIPIADLIAPTPFVFVVLAFRRRSPWNYVAAFCLLAATHLITVQSAVFSYTSTVFEPNDHSIVFAEATSLLYLLLYQPIRFAQVPLALLYNPSRKETSS